MDARSLLLSALLLSPIAAYGAPIPCVSTVPADVGTSTTHDVTLAASDATSCEIVDHQNSGQGGGSFGATTLGTGWSELFHVENSVTSDNTSVGGVTFSNYTFTPLPPGSNAFNGTFGFDWSYPGSTPRAIDFVFSIHAGGNSGYFFFDNVLLAPPHSGTDSGSWTIDFLNSSQRNPGAFSNGQLWARSGDIIRQQVVPEPATLALLVFGFLGLAATRNLRKYR